MFVTDYKLWPEVSEANKQTKPKLLLLYLRALKFQAQSYMEIPLSDYNDQDIQALTQELDKKRNTISGYAMNEPERFWHFLHHLFDKHSVLLAAFDIMGWDIWSQLYKTSYQKLIRLPERKVYPYHSLQVFDNESNITQTDTYQYVDAQQVECFINQEHSENTSVLLALSEIDEWKFVEKLKTKGISSIWIEPSLAVLSVLNDDQFKSIEGVLFNPLKLEGFTPLIEKLMDFRKRNIPVGVALKEGSVIGQTVYAQFAPVLQKVFLTNKPYSLPATGIEVEEDRLIFKQAPGLGLAFVGDFW